MMKAQSVVSNMIQQLKRGYVSDEVVVVLWKESSLSNCPSICL